MPATITLTINPLHALPTAQGKLLDQCAEVLGLPSREIEDPTGYVPVMETDVAYRRRLAARLAELAEKMR